MGLDSALEKIPDQIRKLKNPVFEFNKKLIDATAPFAVAYKPNIAFYECRGTEGWKDLELTAKYIKTNYPDQFLIADAKRGDIGNTSAMYARSFFERMDFDAVTVAPYMGKDSVSPFLAYKGKFIIILALTSNKGASNFQYLSLDKGEYLFSEVIRKSKDWGDKDNIMYVVGATKASMLSSIRKQIPDYFILVPGVGAQGGSLEEVSKHGLNRQCGLLINASRSIIFAGSSTDFTEKAANESRLLQQQMENLLRESDLL